MIFRRGLSKFYQGKSQSFTSLARVGSVEELAKKESAYNRRKSMKGCRSYGGSLNNYKSHTLPKPIISKKNSRGLVSSSSFSNRRGFKASFVWPPKIIFRNVNRYQKWDTYFFSFIKLALVENCKLIFYNFKKLKYTSKRRLYFLLINFTTFF